MKMKWIGLFILSCILFVGAFSCTDTEQYNRDMYFYYMQYARNYEVAAVDEEVKAEYYSGLAKSFQDSSANVTQEQNQKFVILAKTHQENAQKYREVAEQYRDLAKAYE